MRDEKETLQLAILALKEKRTIELATLKNQFLETSENLKLINIIKSTFDEIAASAEIKTAIFENLVGIGTGLIAKKIVNDTAENASKNYLLQIIQFVVTNFIIKNKEDIKVKLEKLFHAFLKSRNN